MAEPDTVRRETILPADTEELWEALTDPESLSQWFGDIIDWEMTPGAAIRVRDAEGNEQSGVIENVVSEHRLQFRWWPVGRDGEASVVTYVLEPDAAGSRLVITERRESSPRASLSTKMSGASATQLSCLRWSSWDTRLAVLWTVTQSATIKR